MSQRTPDPSQEEIGQLCAMIRGQWSQQVEMQRRCVPVDYDTSLFAAKPTGVPPELPTQQQAVSIVLDKSRLSQLDRWREDCGRSRSGAVAELIAIVLGSDPDFE